MSILGNFDRMASLFGLAPKAQVQRRVQLPPWASEGGWSDLQDPDRSTYERQAEQFKASPAFFASLTRIAETAATAKLAVFDGFEEDAEAYETHPFIDLLRQPAPGMEWLALDRFTLIESIVASLGISGDAFLYLGGRSDPSQPPGMLIPLRPDRVELVGQGSVVTGYAYTVMGRTWPISLADIVHFKRYNPSNDLYGLGQADAASLATEADVSAQRHNRALFRNQARLSTVIESDEQFIDEDQRKTMEKWFKDKFTGGPDKAGQVAFLWAGFKARDMGMSQRDADDLAAKTVRNPALALLGLTTPDSFYDSIGSAAARDGFLNRFLIIEDTIGRQLGQSRKGRPDATAISQWATAIRDTKALATGASMEATPTIIPIDAAADRAFVAFEADCLAKMDELEAQGMAELWGRTCEIAMRLALVASQCEAAQVVTSAHAAWAIDLARHYAQVAADRFHASVADSDFEAACQQVYAAIVRAGKEGRTERELADRCRRYRAMRPRERVEVLASLSQLGQVAQTNREQLFPARKTAVWVAITDNADNSQT